jgi:YD repeat-containing protein
MRLKQFWKAFTVRPMLLALVGALGFAGYMPAAKAANGSVAYTYDALGRVTTSSYDTGVCIIYSYDPNGNRLSETVNVGVGGATTWGGGTWGCFTWTP